MASDSAICVKTALGNERGLAVVGAYQGSCQSGGCNANQLEDPCGD